MTEALCALVTPVGLLAGVSPHVKIQAALLTEALRALVTLVGLLAGVSPHVELQGAFQTEALHALVAPVRLLVVVGPHGDDHIGIVGKNLATQDTGPALAAALMPSQLLKADEPHAAVQALGHAVVCGQRAQGLRF